MSNNQDLVALKLVQVPIEEMHTIMYAYGFEHPEMSWISIITLNSSRELLLSHGWTLGAYIVECTQRCDMYDAIARMCMSFVIGGAKYV